MLKFDASGDAAAHPIKHSLGSARFLIAQHARYLSGAAESLNDFNVSLVRRLHGDSIRLGGYRAIKLYV